MRRAPTVLFIIHQDLQSVLRCHIAALEAIGGVPREISDKPRPKLRSGLPAPAVFIENVLAKSRVPTLQSLAEDLAHVICCLFTTFEDILPAVLRHRSFGHVCLAP
jgi:hypothetical protein